MFKSMDVNFESCCASSCKNFPRGLISVILCKANNAYSGFFVDGVGIYSQSQQQNAEIMNNFGRCNEISRHNI